ncbi:MAG: nitroreductase family protein [Opitutales bacterium]|nr:nitroreductase family protein [Opitutales bacterium]
MDLFEAISKRHSYRLGFKDTPIPEADLRKIVQAGLDAPSGKNAQTTTFVIVNDPEVVSRIRTLKSGRKAMEQAAAYIACCLDSEPEAIYHGDHFQIEDSATAVENMLLAITALGYATVWIDGWLRLSNHADQVGKIIGLPANKVVRIILPLGIPAEEVTPPEKRAFEERVYFNRYG